MINTMDLEESEFQFSMREEIYDILAVGREVPAEIFDDSSNTSDSDKKTKLDKDTLDKMMKESECQFSMREETDDMLAVGREVPSEIFDDSSNTSDSDKKTKLDKDTLDKMMKESECQIFMREETDDMLAVGREVPAEIFDDSSNTSDSDKKTKLDKDTLDKMMKVIAACHNNVNSKPFADDVDLSISPEYPNIVKNPMNLKRMRLKVEQDVYNNTCEFIQDMTLIVNNSKLFSGRHSEDAKKALNLRKCFRRGMVRWFTHAVYETKNKKSDEQVVKETKRKRDVEDDEKDTISSKRRTSCMRTRFQKKNFTHEPSGSAPSSSTSGGLQRLTLEDPSDEPQTVNLDMSVDCAPQTSSVEHVNVLQSPEPLPFVQGPLETRDQGPLETRDQKLMETAETHDQGPQSESEISMREETDVTLAEGREIPSQLSDGSSNTSIGDKKKKFDEDTVDKMMKVLQHCLENPNSELFEDDVDPSVVPTYHETIKNPMNLKMMRLKVEQHVYNNTYEFVQDMTLIVNNAKLFNGKYSVNANKALNLRKHFRRGVIRWFSRAVYDGKDIVYAVYDGEHEENDDEIVMETKRKHDEEDEENTISSKIFTNGASKMNFTHEPSGSVPSISTSGGLLKPTLEGSSDEPDTVNLDMPVDCAPQSSIEHVNVLQSPEPLPFVQGPLETHDQGPLETHAQESKETHAQGARETTETRDEGPWGIHGQGPWLLDTDVQGLWDPNGQGLWETGGQGLWETRDQGLLETQDQGPWETHEQGSTETAETHGQGPWEAQGLRETHGQRSWETHTQGLRETGETHGQGPWETHTQGLRETGETHEQGSRKTGKPHARKVMGTRAQALREIRAQEQSENEENDGQEMRKTLLKILESALSNNPHKSSSEQLNSNASPLKLPSTPQLNGQGPMQLLSRPQLYGQGQVQLPSIPQLGAQGQLPSTPQLGTQEQVQLPSIPQLGGQGQVQLPSIPQLGGQGQVQLPSIPQLGGQGQVQLPSIPQLGGQGQVQLPSIPQLGGQGQVQLPSIPQLGGQGQVQLPSIPQLGGQGQVQLPSIPQLGGQGQVQLPSIPQLGAQRPMQLPQETELGAQRPMQIPYRTQLSTQGPMQPSTTPQLGTRLVQLPSTSQLGTQGQVQLPSTPQLGTGLVQLPSTPQLGTGLVQLPSTPQLSTQGQVQLPSTSQLGTQGQVQLPSTSQLGTQGQVQLPSTSQLGTQGQVQLPSTSQLGTQGQVQLPSTPKLGTGLVQLPSTSQLGTQGQVQLPSTPQLGTQGQVQLPSTPQLGTGLVQLPSTPQLDTQEQVQLPSTPQIGTGLVQLPSTPQLGGQGPRYPLNDVSQSAMSVPLSDSHEMVILSLNEQEGNIDFLPVNF